MTLSFHSSWTWDCLLMKIILGRKLKHLTETPDKPEMMLTFKQKPNTKRFKFHIHKGPHLSLDNLVTLLNITELAVAYYLIPTQCPMIWTNLYLYLLSHSKTRSVQNTWIWCQLLFRKSAYCSFLSPQLQGLLHRCNSYALVWTQIFLSAIEINF